MWDCCCRAGFRGSKLLIASSRASGWYVFQCLVNGSVSGIMCQSTNTALLTIELPCPDIKSIGLGGGSIVRRQSHPSTMTIGPDSVGYKLTDQAVVFGGQILTATDCAVSSNPSLGIGNTHLVQGILTEEEQLEFGNIIRHKLEKVIDTMKTSPDDLTVIMVGGGAIISPDGLQGASKVIKPRWSEVANAIGAATARVSAVVDTIKSTESRTAQQLLDEICNE